MFTPLNELPTLAPQTTVNVLATFHKSSAYKRFKNASGKEPTKREILLVDSTMAQVVCTLSGFRAKEDISSSEGRPLILKNVRLSQFNGSYSLHVGTGATVLFDLVYGPAATLAGWYATVDFITTFTPN